MECPWSQNNQQHCQPTMNILCHQYASRFFLFRVNGSFTTNSPRLQDKLLSQNKLVVLSYMNVKSKLRIHTTARKKIQYGENTKVKNMVLNRFWKLKVDMDGSLMAWKYLKFLESWKSQEEELKVQNRATDALEAQGQAWMAHLVLYSIVYSKRNYWTYRNINLKTRIR